MQEIQDRPHKKRSVSILDKESLLEKVPPLEKKKEIPEPAEQLAEEKQIESTERAGFEKESVKESVREKTELEPVQEAEAELEPSPKTLLPPAEIQSEIQRLKSLDQQNQVKALCDLSFQKGLDFAIEAAKGLDNAYVLDEFHDQLVDKLYQRLVDQGRLKQLE